MKTISSRLAAHLAQSEISIAFLFKVVRTDGTVFGFTNHDFPITFTDDTSPFTPLTYQPLSGATPSATETTSDMTTSNLQVLAFLESEVITEVDLIAGKYDYASILVYIVNWQDLTMGALLWKNGTLGEVKIKNGQFQAELRGLEFYLNTNIGDTYGPTCRVDLGDSKCTVNLSLYIQDGHVVSVTDLQTFVPSSLFEIGVSPTTPAPSGWFTNGVITWLTGQNAGFSMEINGWDATTLSLFENMPYPIAPGDTFTIVPGCDQTTGPNGCQKYNNIDNYRGEPFIPGQNQIMIYPNANGSVPS